MIDPRTQMTDEQVDALMHRRFIAARPLDRQAALRQAFSGAQGADLSDLNANGHKLDTPEKAPVERQGLSE